MKKTTKSLKYKANCIKEIMCSALELNGSFPDSLKPSFLKNNWQLQSSALEGCSGNKGERIQRQVKKSYKRVLQSYFAHLHIQKGG